MDAGFKSRMNILTSNFQRSTVPLLESHGWTWEIEDTVEQGEYLVIKICRGNWTKRFAILYSQSTDKQVYNFIEQNYDACLINNLGYDPKFLTEFFKPIERINNFISILKDWTSECTTYEEQPPIQPRKQGVSITPKKMYLSAENPSEQYWMFIKALRSREVCKKFLLEKFHNLSNDIVNSKLEGISFLLQNACDYFETAQNQNTTQRLLNLYYGTLSFIEADILMNSVNYIDLKSVEDITKRGHGLKTYISDNNYNIDSLYTYPTKQGLFSKWVEVYKYDINNFPANPIKKDDEINEYCYHLNEILNRIPELASLMRLVDENYTAGFFEPYFAIDLNSGMSAKSGTYQCKNEGSYIVLLDKSGCSDIDMTKKLIGDFEQQSIYTSSQQPEEGTEHYLRYKAFLKHSTAGDKKFWFQHINIHHSNFCSDAIIIPLKHLKDDWIVYAVMALYTFSIIVRYYPNIWRRIQYGEWDKYYAVCLQFAMIIEKILPHIFYERISGQKLRVTASTVWG